MSTDAIIVRKTEIDSKISDLRCGKMFATFALFVTGSVLLIDLASCAQDIANYPRTGNELIDLMSIPSEIMLASLLIVASINIISGIRKTGKQIAVFEDEEKELHSQYRQAYFESHYHFPMD